MVELEQNPYLSPRDRHSRFGNEENMHLPLNWALRMDEPEVRAFYTSRLEYLRKTAPDDDHTHFLIEAFRLRDELDQGLPIHGRRWLGKADNDHFRRQSEGF